MFARTRKKLSIQTQLYDSNIIAEVDRRQIEQVLLDLYVNASRAMPEGGILRIETNIETSDINNSNAHINGNMIDMSMYSSSILALGWIKKPYSEYLTHFSLRKRKPGVQVKAWLLPTAL
jgi:signal transduction histidine kinase